MAKQSKIPGMFKVKPEVGEQKVRLKAEVAVTVTDTWSGEKCKNVIPLETDDPSEVMDILDRALCHDKTRDMITIFVDGRKGASGTEEEKVIRQKAKKGEPDPLDPTQTPTETQEGAEAH